MKVSVSKSNLCGKICIPSSKSAAHRAIINAALANGTSRISGVTMSNDISTTISALEALGADIEVSGGTVIVTGIKNANTQADINCGESGSTLRFLIPVAAALGVRARFTGTGRLPERPLSTITELLNANGVKCDSKLPLTVDGRLNPGKYRISGDISSQFITGLIYALCIFESESEIILTTPLQSAGYVDMTLDYCNKFGCTAKKTDNGFTIKGRGKAADITLEGDYSQAAFYLEAAALGGNIEISGLDYECKQGDKQCVELFRKIGCNISSGDNLCARRGRLLPTDIDAAQIPDLVPALAVTLAFADGVSHIYNAGRLRIKESDRLDAVAQNLTKMGIRVEQTPDSITIFGGNPRPAQLSGYNDHRIVMAFAIAAAAVGNTTITDAESVNKSYPSFFDDFKSIGGKANVF